MKNKEYRAIESHMLAMMKDSAHDARHIYRVLNAALDIASFEKGVDYDVLIAACLLHDIGRAAQSENPKLCHAKQGAEMAEEFLIGLGWKKGRAKKARHCIARHRYRGGKRPESLEAKILFDADKLDVTGAMGVARTLLYQGSLAHPLYNVDGKGRPLDGAEDGPGSFFTEYQRKLKCVYTGFYTKRAGEIGKERRHAMDSFCNALLREARQGDKGDKSVKRLRAALEKSREQ